MTGTTPPLIGIVLVICYMKFLEWKIPAASCEQLFQAGSLGQPTVVLSNDEFINAFRATELLKNCEVNHR